MSIRVVYDIDSDTYSISNGAGSVSGISGDEYRRFVADVRCGVLNPLALMRQAADRRALADRAGAA